MKEEFSKKYEIRIFKESVENVNEDDIIVTFNCRKPKITGNYKLSVNILMDHPYLYLTREVKEMNPEKDIAIAIDEDHLKKLKEINPEIKSYFVPLGGTIPSHKSDKKEFDICFIGNIKNVGMYCPQEAVDLIDLMAAKNCNVIDVLKEIPDTSEKRRNVIAADQFYRDSLRIDSVRRIISSGVKVALCGFGLKQFVKNTEPNNVTFFNNFDNFSSEEIICKSKLSLNTLPCFKRGPHDRIYTSFLCDSLPITDSNEYLDKEFENKKNILFFKDVEEIPDLVKYYVTHDKERISILNEGKEIVKNNDTWGHRAKKIMEIINENIRSR